MLVNKYQHYLDTDLIKINTFKKLISNIFSIEKNRRKKIFFRVHKIFLFLRFPIIHKITFSTQKYKYTRRHLFNRLAIFNQNINIIPILIKIEWSVPTIDVHVRKWTASSNKTEQSRLNANIGGGGGGEGGREGWWSSGVGRCKIGGV